MTGRWMHLLSSYIHYCQLAPIRTYTCHCSNRGYLDGQSRERAKRSRVLMKQTFWLLDLNHETYQGKSSIWLWGITHDGKRVLVTDSNYRAYFYLLPREGQDPEHLRKSLEEEKPHPTIENATIEKKRLLAEERFVPHVI